jgi:hypothetical protein
MRLVRTAVAILISPLLMMLFVHAAAASQAPMRITDVRFTDLDDPTQIEIVGTQLDNGAPPVVTLEGSAIIVHSATGTLIEAELPGILTDGDYAVAVSTGPGNKQNAEHGLTASALIPMTVSCVDWFTTTGHGEHIHNELHIEDTDGAAVLGASVVYTTAFRTFEERDAGEPARVFQTNLTASSNTVGHNRGEGCVAPSGSGVTGWFCCIGAGKHDADSEIPGKKSCPVGEYTYEVISVDSPEGTPLVWDGDFPGPLSIDFDYSEE